MKIINMSEKKTRLLSDLNDQLDFLKCRRASFILDLKSIENEISQTEELINDLMGLPLKID